MPLSFILSKQQENSRRMRWVMEMSEYLMEIKYIPGKKNIISNGLSRQGAHESYLTETLAESYGPKLYAVYQMLTTENER
ncbi:b(0,+)-type amino acid transporter 1 [Entomophthora muscae]|uniref:B(0,+)-type amino acid transporter 1 n=1 Tax=Entomophthora muscae TaxID=34485 RepID=A0ACC2TCR9_9FUNG|nr:b(0,+)-type amino acid transporter 1 [Entomophthora muscae]